MTQNSSDELLTLAALGWSEAFDEQLAADEVDLVRLRVATVHRARMTAIGVAGPVKLSLPAQVNTGDYAVGDWVLAEPGTNLLIRRLERQSLLQRRTEGSRGPQLIAANVDTLFIVTSCNADFNPARLERYLALSNEAGCAPVIVLTKADQVESVEQYREQAEELQRDLPVVALNAKLAEAATPLAPWCGAGQTVALVGSSGVGKSTLLNTLAATAPGEGQETGGIREGDAKGRHTTTARSLHAIKGGGWVIDTPGMRTLHMSDAAEGLEAVFAEITELAPGCKFRDCTHEHEPGCAVQAAIASGDLDPARLDRWRKLLGENRENTPVQTGPRGNRITQMPGRKR
ncbi:ribosome small subunit-dependent GTPase A [Puniceibacterium sediminis]|uniref:Small ribosomal subunit biogenesis GTPase RsgA n=1 Tax=Puniceibacterium sediminis TaxID=1608407 RepID=A0A238VIA9_9RHOB|nr:ribosome small subunit-dependent GTPase A [Puniceibacterium sediminis]SNR33423.1 ribosome biogenesis GTPase [Puniceibacterium sediminis]